MKGLWISYSTQELAWIKAMATEPRAEAHRLFVQVFNRPDVNLSNFKALCSRKGWTTGRTGQFQKGNVPFNAGRKGFAPAGSEKGWFRKGERCGIANTLYQPIGTEKIRDGYLTRKVNDDLPLQRRWRAVHLINWEALHGPLPPGHILKCLDGNKLNTDPSNWACIPRAMLPRLTGRYGRDYETAPPELKSVIMATVKLEHAAREARKAGQNG